MKKVRQRSWAWIYARELLLHGPPLIFQATKAWGLAGFFLSVQKFLFNRMIFPVVVPHFGVIRSRHEAINFLDNFVQGELRFDEVESELASARRPLIVDIGINTGMTLRWWRRLNPQVHVVGIDMIPEAVAFSRRVWDEHPGGQLDLICSGVGAVNCMFHLSVSDPLEGTNSLAIKQDSKINDEGKLRSVEVRLLDDLMKPWESNPIDLLKIDVEGYGGPVLSGATKTLLRAKWIVIETHGSAETRACSRKLTESGFDLYRIFGRTGWWRKSESF